MDTGTLYSIVVPVYKVEKYLEQCVDSLLSQSYTNIEVILVDDGSPDNCPQICDRYAQKDARVKVIHKEHGGASTARKAGVEAAAGGYIFSVDSDDWIDEKCVETVNEAILRNENPDVVCFGYYNAYADRFVKGGSAVPPGIYSGQRKREMIFPRLIQDENARYFSPSLCMKCIRRDLLTENLIGHGEAVIGEDMASTVLCVYYGESICVLEESLYYYRYNEDSITRGKRVYPWNCAKVLAGHLEKAVDLKDGDLQMQVYRYVVHMLFNTAASRFYQDLAAREIRKEIAAHLQDTFYAEAISKCRFRRFSKGWIAHFALKNRLYGLIKWYSKKH